MKNSKNNREGKIEVSQKKTSNPKDNMADTDFPIVGIGASAGGLESLELFFSNLPKFPGIAFIVIQHLDPNRKGIMPELLQRITPLQVSQAEDATTVMPDCVYVIPPNKDLSILNGKLFLLDRAGSPGIRLPIDFFFRSLADDRNEKSIGIILSGMGSDGSSGIKAIKEKNGIVLIQDPQNAKFNGMPSSAMNAVVADIVAKAEELPVKLINYLKFKSANGNKLKDDANSKINLSKIFVLLREQTGNDFSQYKKNTILRRIERRKGIHQIDQINKYVRFLQENPGEINLLFKELLIGVTSFFRDKKVWDALKDKVLPELFKKLPDEHVIRVWVPGCSTGEEAYSLAIVFREVYRKFENHKNLSIQIFATDIDQDAIDKARRGVFVSNIKADISADRIKQFFTTEGEGYRINSSIREMVVFAQQNVIKDPPFTKLDLLLCRNVLIYLEPTLQNKLISLFGYSLNPDGLLVLGSAETLGKENKQFFDVDPRLKIYARNTLAASNDLVNFPSSFYHKEGKTTQNKMPQNLDNIQSMADQIILQHYAPASVMINQEGDIIYITGRTGKYLEPAAGKANWNIYAMLRPELNKIFPGALRKARASNEPVVIKNIKVGTNGGVQFVDVTIHMIDKPEPLKDMMMVLFSDAPHLEPEVNKESKPGKPVSKGRMRELELELQRAYEDLQTTREEMQTSQEELKSTNEELQSTNEELQSTNEELTTSKEEMQSLNEELQTVNSELQTKVNDFARSNDDMKNLLNSIEVATLFLDKKMNIRRFTDQATKIFKLRPSDIGRPFTDLVTYLRYPDMDKHARHVLKTLTSVETAIATNDERWFTVRIMPYRTLDDRIDGLVITFLNITPAKKLEIELKEANEMLKRKIDNK
jgi:two-component system CheB/CheR fusion protein